jgi:uncharacterized protein DUF3106
MHLRSSILLSLTLFGVVLVPSLSAQGHHVAPPRVPPARSQTPARSPLEEFERMSPEQQRQALEKLPPERRQKAEERLRKLRNLPPTQRSNLLEQYGRFQELSPERQDAVRAAWKQFAGQPLRRRHAIRKELRSLADLPLAERQSRLGSPEFRSSFKPSEQQIIKDMTDVLPRE